MKKFSAIIAFFLGLLFGVGLIVSGMTQPEKVLGFLDIAGLWNPSLAFVMFGAVIVGSIGFKKIKNKPTSALGFAMQWPNQQGINVRLILGSTVFGIGWGLAGICPGPAIVLLGLEGFGENLKIPVFIFAMALGMLLEKYFSHLQIRGNTNQ